MPLDSKRDNIYNIILSIFLGVSIILGLHYLHDSTRMIVLKSNRTEGFEIESKCFEKDPNS